MAVVDISRKGVTKVLEAFGASFNYWSATPTYNARGDETISYGAATDFLAAMAPASKEEIREVREFGRPITSRVILVCQPTVGIDLGDKVSIFSDDYEVTRLSAIAVSGTKIYKRVLTDKIQHI